MYYYFMVFLLCVNDVRGKAYTKKISICYKIQGNLGGSDLEKNLANTYGAIPIIGTHWWNFRIMYFARTRCIVQPSYQPCG